jgi:nucleotide-binding universal stress UspA family protein
VSRDWGIRRFFYFCFIPQSPNPGKNNLKEEGESTLFKHIVVAVDGSEHSDRALQYAKMLAECFGSVLRLVHAFPQTSDLLGYEEYEKLVSRRELAGQAVLDEARQKLGPTNIDVHEELLEGPPAEAILAVAETRQADLIVMGTRGLSTIPGLLLGSVSHKVIRHSACPVMLTR